MPQDSFGIDYIYPSKQNGEHWEMNNDNFNSDSRIQGDDADDKGDYWEWSGSGIRTGVTPSSGYNRSDCNPNHQENKERGYLANPEDWKNCEFGGHVRITDEASDEAVLFLRGGHHTGDGWSEGCCGTAYKSDIDMQNGDHRYAKEEWHVSYDFTSWKNAVNDPGDWFGWKFITYNSQNGESVILETWIDQNADNNWQKLDSMTDSGNWSNNGGECKLDDDGSPITWGGPLAAWRNDAGAWGFKNFTCREIDAYGDLGSDPGGGGGGGSGSNIPDDYHWPTANPSCGNDQYDNYHVFLESGEYFVAVDQEFPQYTGFGDNKKNADDYLLYLQTCQLPGSGPGGGDSSGGEGGSGVNGYQIKGSDASGDDGNVPSNAYDGNVNTRWSDWGLGQYIVLDLGSKKSIDQVKISWYKGDERKRRFIIYASEDKSTYTQAIKGESSGNTLSLETYNFSQVSGQYVKIFHNNDNAQWFSITEIEVHGPSSSGTDPNDGGTDQEEPPPPPDRIFNEFKTIFGLDFSEMQVCSGA